jgi:hypothetical protein
VPLSATHTSSAPFTVSVTEQRPAAEWRTTLVSASVAIRYAATSTAAGSGGVHAGPSTSITSGAPPPASGSSGWDRLAAFCWIAATSPTSSRAGGRRSSTSRRISAMAALVSPRNSASRRFTRLKRSKMVTPG